jgi:hypothetical protein
MSKSAQKTAQKSEQLIQIKKVSGRYTPESAIKVTNLKQAKRLLSRLIYDLQTGTIENQNAKDLTYLLVSYVNVFKQYEIEQRLDLIEKQINDRNH